jgi:hypothetical protein
MRVQPSGEQPFEVELKASLNVLFMPRAGDSIDVLYDPGDHSRVVIDPAQDLAPRWRPIMGQHQSRDLSDHLFDQIPHRAESKSSFHKALRKRSPLSSTV